ncbi:Sec-independent protein translocase protein TatB [Williamsia sterculiae]|uniref:Sec-independent protein translocase protein TatB n=1 Tax=Williamsia sterculiae TaxID=1344003 RepID=A0A1N7E0S4_9NOCA|nr:Sec-independent protein translocase protein TatB [Williamsia sterculiae]SIR81641.1 sec-independent protein translocase protein TatB [Williamsia sterculiae]
MFSSVGWGELLVLLVAGLVILGPERLPGAVSWTMQSIRKAREYATGATDDLKNELGDDFEDLRKPLAELNQLRGMTPRSMITKHLLDGDDSIFRDFEGRPLDPPAIKPVSAPMPGVASPAPETSSVPSPSAPSGSAAPVDLGKADGSAGAGRSVADWDAT